MLPISCKDYDGVFIHQTFQCIFLSFLVPSYVNIRKKNNLTIDNFEKILRTRQIKNVLGLHADYLFTTIV